MTHHRPHAAHAHPPAARACVRAALALARARAAPRRRLRRQRRQLRVVVFKLVRFFNPVHAAVHLDMQGVESLRNIPCLVNLIAGMKRELPTYLTVGSCASSRGIGMPSRT